MRRRRRPAPVLYQGLHEVSPPPLPFALFRRADCYFVTTTSVPTVTRSNRSTMSWLYMRMQPYDAKVPIEDGLLVPWIAYSPPESVSARGPIGLPGEPPGITCGSFGLSALTSAGGVQAGWI